MNSTLAFFILFLGFMLLAAIRDLIDLRIPNALTAAMASSGPVALVLLGPGFSAVPAALLTGASVLGISWGMFQMGWLGGGDAKLATAASVWLGAEATLVFVLTTALFGAVLGVTLLVLSRCDAARALVGDLWRQRLESERIPVPYAIAMLPGGAVALSVITLA